MAATNNSTSRAAELELVITRVFDAPRDLVFKAWTDPKHVMRWLGPKGFTALSFETDLRPGGAHLARMRSPESTEYSSGGVIREIRDPELLVFTFAWGDEPDHEMLITITFIEREGKTEMTFRQSGFKSVESSDSHKEGWNESFDKLAEYLGQVDPTSPADREIVRSRAFDG